MAGQEGAITTKQKYQKKYYAKHREDSLAYSKKYYAEHRDRTLERQGAHRRERREELSAYDRAYNAKNREKRIAHKSEVRLQALQIITGADRPVCARCGCDDVRLLEINHKNGGGGKEARNGLAGEKLVFAITAGRRSVSDLEVLCRPCNAIHYLELIYGPLPMRIVWNK